MLVEVLSVYQNQARHVRLVYSGVYPRFIVESSGGSLHIGLAPRSSGVITHTGFAATVSHLLHLHPYPIVTADYYLHCHCWIGPDKHQALEALAQLVGGHSESATLSLSSVMCASFILRQPTHPA